MLVLILVTGACTTVVSESIATPEVTTESSIYGSGVRGGFKGNAEIGRSWGDIAFRFRASTTSAPTNLHWSLRTGPEGYSGGNGGTIRIGIQGDDGTANHHPDGRWLTYTDVKPGNPGAAEAWFKTTFSGAPTLTSGKLYHVVFKNISADPFADWVSVNCLGTWFPDGTTSQPGPYHAAWPNRDMAYLRNGPDNWRGSTGKVLYTPFFDLEYADGTNDGNAYGFADPKYDRLVAGKDKMVRERFTVSGGDKTVTGVHVALGRVSGSGDVTIRLEDASGARIDSITVPGSDIVAAATGTGFVDMQWLGGAFASPHTLSNGKTYRLRVHSAPGSTYFARPLFWAQGFHVWELGIRPESWHFEDGSDGTYGGGEYTTDGGGSWSGMYSWLPQDLQFYFTVR